jgi:hypothetical protein
VEGTAKFVSFHPLSQRLDDFALLQEHAFCSVAKAAADSSAWQAIDATIFRCTAALLLQL